MSNEKSSQELSLEEKVFEQMNGYYETQEVPGVRDESRDGFVRTYIDRCMGRGTACAARRTMGILKPCWTRRRGWAGPAA